MSRLSGADIMELEVALRGTRDDLLRHIYRNLPGESEEAQKVILRDLLSGRVRVSDLPGIDIAARQLHDIDEALKRIDYGVAGICSACGGCIQPERLRAHPTTTLCGSCQQRLQKAELPSG